MSDQEFDYSRCSRCGVRFLAQRPPDSELGQLYPDAYGPYAPTPGIDHPRPSAQRLRRLLSGLAAPLETAFPDRLNPELESFYRPERDAAILLDYGCGSSSFLDTARGQGWQTAGADFSQAVVERVRVAGHAGFLVGEELADALADATVARVRMNHVLEHLPDPASTLSQLRRKMVPGGRIHLATPSPIGIGSMLFRTRWFSLDCPRHLCLYPPRLVRELLCDAGFQRPRVLHETVSKDLVRSWDYVLHDLGRISRKERNALTADEARLNVMRLPAKLAALLSISDRFHVFADA